MLNLIEIIINFIALVGKISEVRSRNLRRLRIDKA